MAQQSPTLNDVFAAERRGRGASFGRSTLGGLILATLLSPPLVGCETAEPPVVAAGVDVVLPDGGSPTLDGLPTLDEVRPTSPAPAAVQAGGAGTIAGRSQVQGVRPGADRSASGQAERGAPVAQFRGGAERAGVHLDGESAQLKRRYHLAWVSLSVPQPDGSVVVNRFERAQSGAAYWSEPTVEIVRPAGSAPQP